MMHGQKNIKKYMWTFTAG